MRDDFAQLVEQVGTPCWLSHHTAADAWALDLIDLDIVDRSPRVTVPRTRTRHAPRGVRIHRVDLRAEDKDTIEGIPVTGVRRTLHDIARTTSPRCALAAADSALRAGLVSEVDLRHSATSVRGPGAGRVLAMASLADKRAGSVLESAGRLLLIEAGLDPELQVGFATPNGTFYVDLVIGDLVIEFDGHRYHGPEKFQNDRSRDQFLLRRRYRVVRFTWDDVIHRPEWVVETVLDLLAMR